MPRPLRSWLTFLVAASLGAWSCTQPRAALRCREGGGGDTSAGLCPPGRAEGECRGDGDCPNGLLCQAHGCVSACPLPALPPGALDVKTFGARGDGVTDDTAAIQRAVDAAPAGGTVHVPDGVYRVSTDFHPYAGNFGLALKSDLTLLLSPHATLEAVANGRPGSRLLAIWGARNVTVAGGTLRGDRYRHLGSTGEWGMGIDIESSSRVSIRGVTVEQFWGDGLYVSRLDGGASSTDVEVCGVTADDNRRQGMSVADVDGMKVTASTFSRTAGTAPAAGVDFETNAGLQIRNVTVRGCRFLGNQGDGLVFTSPFGYTPAGVVTASVIEQSTLSGNGGNGLSIWNASRITVDGNTLEANGEQGVQLQTASACTLAGNTLAGNGKHGLWLVNASSDNVAADNTLLGNGASRDLGFDGIRLAYGSSRNLLEHNVVHGGSATSRLAWGIRILDPSCSANRLVGNDLAGADAGGSLRDEGTGSELRP